MSKETIHYICGHDGVANLVGNVSMRSRKAKWLGEKKCPDCERKELEAFRAAQNEASAKANADMGLPALQGTPKQIAWAETIRAKALASKENEIPNLPGDFDEESCEEMAQRLGYDIEDVKTAINATLDAASAARGELLAQAEASWWIDNNHKTNRWVREAAEETEIHYSRMMKAAKKEREAK